MTLLAHSGVYTFVYNVLLLEYSSVVLNLVLLNLVQLCSRLVDQN
jgi:hypothetical protein